MCLRTVLFILVLAAGCATTQPEVGMEAPGRPAVMWHSEEPSASPTPQTPVDTDTERQLLAELEAEEHKGTKPLAVASTLYNLAILRRQQGSFAEAERLYRKALGIREHEQGPNHPDVAVILNNLAALEVAQGRYADALPLLARALTIRQAALGNAHVLTAQSLNNLALLYAAQGDAAAAEPLYTQALAILEAAAPAPQSGEPTPGVQPPGSQPGDPRGADPRSDDPRSGDPRSGELGRVLDNYAALLHDTGRDLEAEKLEARARALHAGNGPDK